MKQYYTIGEIAKIYQIGRDSLMYYEELEILNPIRNKNGYRMYNIFDIWKLNLIKELRNLDFSMKRIKDYLDDRNLDSTINMLNEEINLIDNKILELISHKNNIYKRLQSINDVNNNSSFYNIDLVYMEDRKCIKLNANIKKDEEVDFLIQKLRKEHEINFDILGNNNIGAIFNIDKINMGIYNEYSSIFCFVKNDEELFDTVISEGYYVTMNYKGSYRNNRICLNEMFKYINLKNYHIIGCPIEIYKIDIHETNIVDEFITEIQIPVKI